MVKERNNEIKIDGMGYHFESLKDFENSFYKNVYKEAYLRVDDIIKHAKVYDKTYKRISSSIQSDFPNIITFIGARGVGKTSVMLSFMEALKDYSNNNRNQGFYSFSSNENIVFTCLDCIDGSLMEHGEDIFKTILAQMYRKFTDLEAEGEIHKSSDFDFRKQELLRGLEDVYRTVCEIENMSSSQFMAGEAYMSSLRSFSSSQKVRRDLVNLIKRFTDLMRYNRYGQSELSGEHYVVIAIDDIDLNIQNSFSMLEKIHRYCTVPNVIVLLTLDIQQMLSIVTRHFYEVAPKVNKLLVAQEQYVRNLSMDYLEKVLPINYRIYMPMMDKDVVISKESNSIKETILGKIYRRTGICFDSKGLKQHFYVPGSIRELTGFYLMLESLNKIQEAHFTDGSAVSSEKMEEFIATFEENYSILLSDLKNRIVLEKLSRREDVEFFDDIVHSDIRRAMTSVKEYYLNCENRLLGKKEKNSQHGAGKDVDEISYGELLETIYDLGRLQNRIYKPMVHCLLAYFSFALTREYIQEKIQFYKESEERSYFKNRLIEEIVGGHVLYHWANELIPKISVVPFSSQGMLESSGGQNQEIKPKGVGRLNRVRLSNVLALPIEEEILDKKKTDYCDEIAKVLRKMELLTLFFSGFTLAGAEENEGLCPWKFKLEKGRTGKVFLVYDNSREDNVLSGRADFNVLNIITNSMYASQKLECVEQALVNAVTDYFAKEDSEKQKDGENQKNTEKDGEKQVVAMELKGVMKRYSLKEEYETWEQKYGGPSMPLPLWWFDFSYNILKRTKRTMKKKTPATVKDDYGMYRYTRELYKCISEQIQEQQKFYNTENTAKHAQEPLKISEQFKECPGIKVFIEGKVNNDVEDAVNVLFEGLKNSASEEEGQE